MGDPERLLSSTRDDDEMERDLLGSLRDVAPAPSAKNETWKRLAVSTAAVATLATSSAAVQALGRSGIGVVANATKALTAKVVLGVAIAGSTAAGGGWLLHQRSTEAARSTAARSAPPSLAAPAPPPAVPALEAPLPALEAPPEPAPPSTPSQPGVKPHDRASKSADDARARRDSLAMESRMLTEARSQLHAGDARGALATLEKLRARSPRGVLTQERDVLAIQILSSLGDIAAAKRKAKEFLEAYPESPHAPQLRRLVGDG
jgi:hypothetical protein